YMRIYQFDNIVSHLIGYTNKPNREEVELPFISNMPNLEIGKDGIEKSFNPNLIGKPGQREIEVNSYGRVIREISRQDSQKGNDIQITIDLRIQKYALELLKEHKAGSVVLMDINNGNILCMASTPSYNPNKIIQKPNKEYWDSILENELSPLTYRCIQGLYAPGSTFKMVVAIAGIVHGFIDTNTKHFCSGKIGLGERLYHCWKNNGHGSMNVSDAIKESCDVFFYEISKKIGIDKIAKVAKDFGLGKIYDVPLPNQKKGIIPSRDWKKKKYDESWYPGETLISAIGQGFVLTNPLQLAVMTSIIASNGKNVIPNIIKQNSDIEFEKLEKYQNAIEIIKSSMFKAVNESKGTAYNSRSASAPFAGKTGTSQVRRITVAERESEDFRKKEVEWKKRDHALFVGYMPVEKPRYAVSVVIEHGGSGASTAAPIAKEIFQFTKNLEI
ncbi:penicillin-binding protein 2, partial [Pelagibacteraceae bacterium]|nr:penicillin-binding protein 2 [Pelagibacteraceae bacterium]